MCLVVLVRVSGLFISLREFFLIGILGGVCGFWGVVRVVSCV